MIAAPPQPKADAPASRSTPVIAIEPLAVGADAAGALVGASGRAWRRWNAAGLVPTPVRIGGSVRWDVSELRLWITARCPSRVRWTEAKCLREIGF